MGPLFFYALYTCSFMDRMVTTYFGGLNHEEEIEEDW